NYHWQMQGEVTDKILTLSAVLPLQALPSDRTFATLHSYTLDAPTPRYLYVKVDKGISSFGDYILTDDYSTVIPVPPYPNEINFLHKGSLLALSDEKKLSMMVRGLPAVHFSIARILPGDVNQLITQTQG